MSMPRRVASTVIEEVNECRSARDITQPPRDDAMSERRGRRGVSGARQQVRGRGVAV